MANYFDQFDAGDNAGDNAGETGNYFDQFDSQGEAAPEIGITGTLKEGVKSAARAIGATANAYTGDNLGIVDKAKAQQEAPKDARLDKFYSDFTERTDALGEDPGVLDTIGEAAGAVWDNPAGAGLAVVEQLPNAAPALAGGYAGLKAGAALGAAAGAPFAGVGAGPGAAIGGVVGGLAGMFLGNTAIETGHKAMGFADDGAVTDEERGQAISEGAIKGGVITGVDALTLGVGGKLAGTLQRTTSTAIESATRKALLDRGVDVADNAAVLAARSNPEIASAVRAAQESARTATDKLGKRMAVGGTLLGMETVGEGVGEYLGELAATGEGNVPDAVLESMLSLGQSGAETAFNMARKSPAKDMWIQPAPTAENPAPAPVPRPDPNAGALSRAAALLPAPDRLGLPAPDSVMFADDQGNVSDQAPLRDVDREYRPTGRERDPQTFGAGMDQQTERGTQPGREGDYIPASRFAGQQDRIGETIDGQLAPQPAGLPAPQQRLADGRPDAGFIETNAAGESRQAKAGNVPPKDYVPQGGRGMDQQTPVGKRYSNALQAKNAIQKAGVAATHEAVQVAPKQFEVRAKQVPKKRIVNRDRDSLTQAITRLGGIKTNYRQDTTGDTKGNKFLPGVGALWSDRTGTSLDDMASLLDQNGYVPAGEMNNLGGVPWLQSALGDELSGRKTHYAPGSARQEIENVKAEAERYSAQAGDLDARLDEVFDLTEEVAALEARRLKAEQHAAELDALFGDSDDAQTASPRSADQGAEQTEATADAASDSDRGQQQGQGSRTGAPRDTPAEALELTQQTEAELADLDRQQKERAKAEAEVTRKAEEQARKAADAAFAKQQNEAANAEFTLGGDAEQNLTGQRGMFDAPADPQPTTPPSIEGADIDGDWALFSKGSGTLGIARADMPQIKAEHRGAMVNFLNARDISHQEETVPAGNLKPTQAEYSRKKVEKAKAFDGGDRSILISKDGHVLDGHHQWLARRDTGEDVKVIRLDAPIKKLLGEVAEFPSATQDDAGSTVPVAAQAKPAAEPASKKPAEKLENFGEKLQGKREYAASSLSQELTDEQITVQPLSKIWPANEIDAIGDKFSAAMAYAARAEIPAKPRKGYKLGRWVGIVKTMRELSAKVLNNQARARELLSEMSGLEGFASKVALLEAVDRGQWKRIGKVGVYRDAYSFVDGEQVKSPFAQAEIDGKTQRFDGATDVADIVEAVNGLLEGAAQPKKMQFEIRRARGATVFDVNKVGDKEYRSLKTFPSVKEARAFIEGSHADLVAAWEAVKDSDNVKKTDVRGTENRPRTGTDHRNGKDVTPDQFEGEFGFRGVEFGNWVGQGANSKERQGMLNAAYDALMDLAAIVGIPPKAISLNSSLGLAFGSRGKGNAAAHFEPGNLVINLTKTKGAGSLAHEWFHALDNYFSRRRGGEVPIARGLNAQETYRQQNFITYRPEPQYVHKTKGGAPISRAQLAYYGRSAGVDGHFNPANWHIDPNHPQGVRPEVETAFAGLVQALNDSPMSKRSALNDKSPNGYWGQIIERAARAFENFTISKMLERGYHNDYLANVRQVEDFPRSKARYPYLLPEEVAPIAEAFDGLLDTIETETDAAGNVAMFSRAGGPLEAAGLSPSGLGQGSAAGATRTTLGRGDVEQIAVRLVTEAAVTRRFVFAAWEELPQAIKDRAAAQGAKPGEIKAVHWRGKTYLVDRRFTDARDVERAIFHEYYAHYGLRQQYGKALHSTLLRTWAKVGGTKGVRALAASQGINIDHYIAGAKQDGSLTEAQRRVLVMDELLAHLAESTGTLKRMLQEWQGAIQNWLRSHGWLELAKLNAADLAHMLRDARQAALQADGAPVRGQPLFQRISQTATAAFKVESLASLPLRRFEAARDAFADILDRREVHHALRHMTPHQVMDEVEWLFQFMSRDPAALAMAKSLYHPMEAAYNQLGRLDRDALSRATEQAEPEAVGPVETLRGDAVEARQDSSGKWFKVNGRGEWGVVPHDSKAEAMGDSVVDDIRFNRAEQTDTAAFKQWFGDSQVVDKQGAPKTLYHGTGEDFTVFEQGRAGRSTGHSTAPLGIFLTGDQATAQAYAEKASDGMPGLAKVMPLYAAIRKPYLMSLAESQAIESPGEAVNVRARLEREGYDGIRLKGTDTWIAFSNTQVKSASDNVGTFDEWDADIRFSRSDDAATAEALRKLGLGGRDASGILEQIRNLTLGGMKAKLAEWSTRSEEGLFDGLAGIRRAEEASGINDPDQQGYVSARMATGIADVMHGVLNYAAPEWRDGVIAGKANTRGVLEVLGDLGQDNLTPWLAWLGGKRAQMLKAQGRENNLTDTDIAELLAMGKGKEALFDKVYQDYAKINEAVLDLAEQAGLIDTSARAKWATEYYVPFYRVDESEGLFSGPRSKKGLSHQTAAIKALKGGALPTNDLLTNMLAGWTKRIDASLKNKALLEVVGNLQGSEYLTDESPRYQQVLISRSQIADHIRKDRKALAMAAEMLGLPADSKFLKVANQLMKPENEGFEQMWTRVAPTDPDIIRVQRGGKSEYYRVNEESLLRGLKFMEGSVFNDPITRIGRTFKRLLTTGVTASPDFILRNFIRDAAHAWMINKDGFALGKDSITGMRDALREDQDYRDLMFAGGSFQGGYVHGTDPEASAQIIRRALEKKGFSREQQSTYLGSLINTPAKAAGMLKQGWQSYRTLGDKVENANRLATYKRALAAGKSKRQAAYEAKDLMDYSMRGNFAAAQWFTDVVPFLNARMQGLYKLGRAVKGDKTLLAKEVALKGGYIALFSLLLAGLNDDDERYQELQDWDKDMHWHIFLGEQHFRIPKPFELGLIFGTVPERLLHALTGTQDGGDLAKSVSQGVFHTLAFNPVPQFYQPIRELQANRNFFRDMPIEDMSDEGKLPEARFDERTSALGRGLGQITGPTLGLSPKQIDHLVQGYTGTLGGYVLGMSSLIAEGFRDGEAPAWRAADMPVAKVLYQGDAVRSTKYQGEFYDMLREADQLHRTIKSYREEGQVEAAEKLFDESRDKLRNRPGLGLARKQLGNIRKQRDAIHRNTTMDGETKRQRLDDLQRRANQIAERITRRAGDDF